MCVFTNLRDYTCLRKDRSFNVNSRNPHGGVLFFVHDSLNFKQTAFCQLEFIEAIFIRLSIGAFSFTLGCIYSPSSLSAPQAKHDAQKLLSLPGPFVLAGDFNAKHTSWNNVTRNKKGSDLETICNAYGCDISYPDSPTLYPNGRGDPSIVDFAISKGVVGIQKPVVIDDFSSDHMPICLVLPFNVAFPREAKIPNYAKANWEKFQSIVDNEVQSLTREPHFSLSSPQGIDNSIESFTKLVLSAADRSIPLKKPNVFRYPNSVEIRDLKTQRNALRRASKTNPQLKKAVNSLNKQIKTLTSKLNSDGFAKKLGKLNCRDYSLYQFAKTIKRKFKPIPPLKNENQELTYSSSEKSNLLAKSFLKSHQIALGPTRHSLEISNSIAQIDQAVNEVPDDEKVHAFEIRNIISGLKLGKAPGIDKVPCSLLKALTPPAINFLTDLFNACLNLGHFPKCWKMGKIVSIPKPNKDLSQPGSYRPITLLPNLGKMLERVILNRFQKTADDRIIPQQFGFRQKHSTMQQILRLTEAVSLRFNENKSTAMCSLDLEKAFDSVWHEALLHKIFQNFYPIYLTKIVKSFLSERESFVSVGE